MRISGHETRAESARDIHRFETVKTDRPIQYHQRWHLPWLMMMSLDDNLFQISAPEPDIELMRYEMLVLTTNFSGNREWRLCSTNGVDRRDAGFFRNNLRVDLKRDVMSSAARPAAMAVRAAKDVPVPLEYRFAILKCVDEERNVTIRDLSSVLDVQIDLAAKVVLSLAYQCVVLIDLLRPVTFDTVVKSTQFGTLPPPVIIPIKAAPT